MSLLLLTLPFSVSAADAVSSTFYPRATTSERGALLSITPDREPVTVGATRVWTVQHPARSETRLHSVTARLPREGVQFDISATETANGWTLSPLRFDREGVWVIDIQFETSAGRDAARFKFAIDDTPFVVHHKPTASQIGLIKAMALPLSHEVDTTGVEKIRATLGHALFFDTRLSSAGDRSCASCHVPSRAFSDGLAQSHNTSRNAPGLIGIAKNRWFNRDGSKDSLWSQALGPLEHKSEIGIDRVSLLKFLASDTTYAAQYQAAFGQGLPEELLNDLPSASPAWAGDSRMRWLDIAVKDRDIVNWHFANVGRALAAYQRQLVDRPSPFDRYAHALASADPQADTILSTEAQQGLMLFIGSRTQCLDCHTGPRFSNGRFHNIGTAPAWVENADIGRAGGIEALLEDPFNCKGVHGLPEQQCSHLDAVWRVEVPYLLTGSFMTPGLRNVALTGPWFHDGSATSLHQVMDHYIKPPPSASGRTEHELSPIALSQVERDSIVAFLQSLNAEPSSSAWFRPPE